MISTPQLVLRAFRTAAGLRAHGTKTGKILKSREKQHKIGRKLLSLHKNQCMISPLEKLVGRYRTLGIDRQLDYDKFYLYSIITHSTAIEGSTITELENQIMFDHGMALKGKSLMEQHMNLDLKAAYEQALVFAKDHAAVSVERLRALSALTMKNTGAVYHTMMGDFSSAKGDLRLLNVSAGAGGKSYMSFNKVPTRLAEFCKELNKKRAQSKKMSMQELYDMSFDAHYDLVTIHPWVDGNGRMARLLMNWLQFEYGLIPSRIFSQDKEEYIKVLVETRENADHSIFRQFMTETMIRQLHHDMDVFEQSMNDDDDVKILRDVNDNAKKHNARTSDYVQKEETPETTFQEAATVYNRTKTKTSYKIIALLRENPAHTTQTLAETIGITTKGVEKQLSKLKLQGLIHRIGPDKGGWWEA